ncbi:GRP family sugar transporter [Lacticaseibacillus pantheris]|jgi:glucose uptake protein|uniref:Glucose uptake permease n=1 Tax=Lacticaseibacillus pantheris DSM 15945 = JCM 12539 = NBRC 106106 TaxID=1423783 RepID=A0A0R1TW07_9LACO|nr:GRP family sugar transporter [Lacticaseibacillus pantheris]KRL84388.1 glucose uptake permease [Lacticaseibacillus pantheris DSM 15945 = JCM 12539 = NBRC 106106]WKF84218.1 GRP family sugar transporter [Lacticaseibacillus pantheris]
MAIIIALIPALAWGSIGLVSGKLGGNAYQQTLGMTIGALVFGFGTWVFMQPSITSATWLFGIISGLLWALGQGFQFRSMQQVGVSTAVPISTGMQLVANALAGALLFHEWHSGRDVTLGIIAVGILVIGAALTSRKEKSEAAAPNHMGKGIQSLLISTIGYAGYTVVYTAAGLDAAAVVLPQAVGMLLGAIVLSFGHEVLTKATAKNVATGLLWGVGNLFMLMATKSVGLAIAFSMSQMGIVISTFGGIFLLGEEKTRKEMVYVTVGSLLVILGGVVLGVMKA